MYSYNKLLSGLFSFFIITIIVISIIPLSSATPLTNPNTQEEEPDWSTISGYGVPDDEGMEVYGEPVEVSEADILGYAGSDVHTLTKTQFKEVWSRITKWRDSHSGAWPIYVDVSMYHVGVDKIYKETYMDMHKRWEQWKKEHKGQEPTIIGIEGKT